MRNVLKQMDSFDRQIFHFAGNQGFGIACDMQDPKYSDKLISP